MSVQGADAEVSVNRLALRLCDLYHSLKHMCKENKLCLNQNIMKNDCDRGDLTKHSFQMRFINQTCPC